MAKHHLTFSLIIFIGLFSSMICSCNGNCDNTPDVQPTGIEDFIDNISAHYKNEIQIVEANLFQMEFAFQKQLSVVQYNQELVAKISRQLESRMRSASTFNYKTKLCIQHFMSNVTMENVNIQTKLRVCLDTAKSNSRSIADNAKNQIKNSRAQLQDLVNADLALCRKNNNVQKMTECIREKLKVREVNIQSMLKAAGRDIESCICKSDALAMVAQECSFLIILEVYTLLSEITSNINTCIGERLVEIK